MDDQQISRISHALESTSNAIHGINNKFDVVDEHWQGAQRFHSDVRARVDGSVASFQRLEKDLNMRLEKALEVVKFAATDLTQVMSNMVQTLEEFDIQREIDQLPKAVIPLMVPIVILMIELAIANAYLGILLTKLEIVSKSYSRYLLANAAVVLLGLMVSLLWLGVYRCVLIYRSRRKERRRHWRRDAAFEDPDQAPCEGEEVDEVDKGRPLRTVRCDQSTNRICDEGIAVAADRPRSPHSDASCSTAHRPISPHSIASRTSSRPELFHRRSCDEHDHWKAQDETMQYKASDMQYGASDGRALRIASNECSTRPENLRRVAFQTSDGSPRHGLRARVPTDQSRVPTDHSSISVHRASTGRTGRLIL